MKTPTGTAPATSSIDYTVEENDSLWKIAEEQLGNGIRYQEIIDLNDGITENTVLHKGMKLKLPKE
jgi:nucleoid-associated protein YgaU